MFSILNKIVKGFFFTTCIALFPIVGNAQKVKTNFKNTPGHAIYKKAKLYDSKKGAIGGKPKAVGDKAANRHNYELELLKDPNTGKIPHNIKAKEKTFSKKLPKGSILKKLMHKNGNLNAANKLSTGNWSARGPWNVGGRTRALAIDKTDESVLFAGSVSGGLWRSTDTGTSWTRVSSAEQNPSITAIVQDPVSTNIWYYASGELLGNSANLFGTDAANIGALYQGTGVYKSTDNGLTWLRIVDTNNLDVTSYTDFDHINSIAVNPTNGDLYFSASNGVSRVKSGTTTVEVNVFDATLSYITEVAISPSGKIYVTASKEDGVDGQGNSNNIDARISVSTDGDAWTDITPDGLADSALSLGRILVEIDPSDENFVWVFVDNFIGREFLFRYQVNTNTWVDRSSGLPYSIGGIGFLNTQNGYNMLLKVHPSNSDMVFVGGTNLYRSSNGFSSELGINGWIGGYKKTGGYTVYENHHPDQHNLVFFPSNPLKALSANDGGVQITQNITSGDTVWTSLNNGYLSTQPYAVSFDPSSTTDQLLSGFQDNGTWYTGSTNLQTPWSEQFSGDGGYNAIADNNNTLYVSSQFGTVVRFHYDPLTDTHTHARVTPSIGSGNFEFITPFILDHNNDNIMYMSRGGSMLVNTNLDQIPTGYDSPTDVNWFRVNGDATWKPISAMDVSTYPEQHKLYFGVAAGGFFRVDNAHLPGATRTGNLTAGKNLGKGRITCVYVDPTNSDRVFITKSNYGVISIWMSEDAGESWTAISGNLEENIDGTGNGPSVRSFTMIGDNEGYLAGTTTGLYYTETLNGSLTQWTRETLNIGSETIEDALIMQVKTRNDGFTVAASHGNGIFSTRFAVSPRPQPKLSAEHIDEILLSNDIGSYSLDLSSYISSATNSTINLSLLSNSNPTLGVANLVGTELQLTNINPNEAGRIDVVIEATSGVEKTTLIARFLIREIGIYEQNSVWLFSTPSNYDPILERLASAADDFVVPDGVTWKLNKVVAIGTSIASLVEEVDNATVEIFDDNNGKPGNMVYTTGSVGGLNNLRSEDFESLDLSIPFPNEVTLQSGKYWLVVYARLAYLPNKYSWQWANTDVVVGNEAQFKNPDGFWYVSTTDPNNPKLVAADWTNESTIFGGNPLDHLFYLVGNSETLSTKAAQLENFRMYPNPNKGTFRVKFNATTDKINIKVCDIRGRAIFNKTYNQLGDFNKTINLNAIASGLYIIEVSNGLKKTTKKLLIE